MRPRVRAVAAEEDRDRGVPAGPVQDLEQVFRDPQVLHRQMVVTMDHPTIAEGEGSPYVKAFPKTKEELFKYDLVILGDVGTKSCSLTAHETTSSRASNWFGCRPHTGGIQRQ